MVMKKFDVLWGLEKCETEIQWGNVVGKMVPIDLFESTNFQIVKKKKMQYLKKHN